jgi:alpha-glucosidase
MRPISLSRLTPTSDPLTMTGAHGETLRIDLLDDDLVRVRMLPDGAARLDRTWSVVGTDGLTPREGRMRDDLSPFPMPAFQYDRDETSLTLRTRCLSVNVHYGDGRLMWLDADGVPFAADLRWRGMGHDRAGRGVFHYMERRPDEHYFGFGERSGALDKRGRRMRLAALDALGYNAETSDPLYKHLPFYITFIPTLKLAYGLFYDNMAGGAFDMGAEIDAFWGHYRLYQADDGDLDYYLIYGSSIEGVIEKFTRLTGRPMLPPRWTLGYLGSTMHYTDAPNAQDQLREFVELCDKHDIPCDLFHLSSGYTTDSAGRRNVFTWNASRIPDPEGMIQSFHDAGIRLAANIKPYLLTTHPDFEAVKAAGGFIRDPDTNEPALCRFWSGGAFESGEGAYLDFSSAAGFGWWQARLTESLLERGIDAAWNDNNEFELWDDAAVCDGFGAPIPVGLMRPVQTLLMAQASYEAALAHRPNQRPFVLTRSGSAGIQRYAQTWTGDNATSWHTLRWNIPMGLGMGLSGMPNIGHDVGGFYGDSPDPELFIRWVQNGIVHPRFTIHSWKPDGSVNAPWMHPKILPIIRDLIRFRYRLIPYLYTLLVEAHLTGHPIIRPMVYHFPDDPRCRTESFDFMLGSHMLIASVLEPGARKRRVYLPAGSWWCDFHTGDWHAGGAEVEIDAPLDRLPILIRDGGIIPMGKPMRFVGAESDDRRIAHAYAHSTDAAFTLIEDDGVSFAYQRGAFTRVQLSAGLGGEASVRLQLRGCPLPYSEVDFLIRTRDEVRRARIGV